MEWRVIPEFTQYEVSDTGQIRNITTGRLRKLQVHRKGHLLVHAYPGGKVLFVHRAVASAFIGPVTGKVVRHLDGDPTNNNLTNLAIGTQRENMLDAVRHGTHTQAAKSTCPSGHKYTVGNTRLRHNGWRACISCERSRTKIITKAARSIGVSYDKYISMYGQSLKVAKRMLSAEGGAGRG